MRTTGRLRRGWTDICANAASTRVFLAGLAYDYCVGYSALDARGLGFEAVVLKDACRAIDLNGSAAAMEREFAKAGVELMQTADLAR